MRRLTLFCLLLHSLAAQALHIEQISGEGWQANNLRLQLNIAETDASGSIELGLVSLPEPFGDMHKLRLACQPLIFTAQRIACIDAPLTAEWGLLDKPAARASFEYIAATGAMRLDLQGLAALGGQLSVKLKLQAEGWQADVQCTGLQASRVAPLLAAAGQKLNADAGRVNGEFSMQGDDDGVVLAKFDLGLSGLTANDEDGKLASESLNLKLNGQARPAQSGWQGQFSLAAQSGQLYVDPLFFDFGAHPLTLGSQVLYQTQASVLAFEKLHLQHSDTAELVADGRINLGEQIALQALNLELKNLHMSAAYPVYMQPFLLGTGLEELETDGALAGQLSFQQGQPQSVELTVQNVTAHDSQQRYSIDQLNGEVHWNKQAEQALPSELKWASGSAYKLPFEAAVLRIRGAGTELDLLEPFRLGLLGGALKVDKLSAKGLGSEALALQFDGGLEPLSLTELTRALGWPEFAGTLSGRLPDLSYANGELTVGGTLAAQVFDGKLAVDGLRIADPFGRLPRLQADMHFRNLDLAAATSAFQFGAIEGRLHGDVKGLQLLNWQPVAFDARFYTPPDDRSRHRISQRAIENISSIGGAGAGAILSRGFMSFFENFAYAHLGLSCRLANGVCRMGGIEDAPDKGGYYLVKGKLLPRIDVIGYANEVSWSALMEQLRSITAGEGPEVR